MSFGGIFNINSKFSQFMSRLFDLVILNLIFIIMCIPVITIGINFTAMYYVSLKMINNEDTYIIRSYLKAFKENFKQSTSIWLILIAVGGIITGDIYYTNNFIKGIGSYSKYLFYFLGIISCFVMLYVFPIQSKFSNKIKNTMINSLSMSIRHLPYTILIMAIFIVPFVICMNASFSFFFSYIFIGFSATIYINSIILNKIFKNYLQDGQAEHTDPAN
ncbi:DUF624 domain-containing protein [Neobacillus drentensis]|uniref:YesL family protein n=1 Tax=Neobacillus drentensis TaxID=220684 RepID=UPI001F39D760|nr:YesL family protein [Neobacillus drentensis]ULT58721.1 DUF624 domain-containing protein [Neobacillus drentensis]